MPWTEPGINPQPSHAPMGASSWLSSRLAQGFTVEKGGERGGAGAFEEFLPEGIFGALRSWGPYPPSPTGDHSVLE